MTDSIRVAVEMKDFCKPCRGTGEDYRKPVKWGKDKYKIAVICVTCQGKGYIWEKEKIDLEQLKELLNER